MGNMLLIFVTIKIRKEWYISKYWIHTILLFYQGHFFSGLPLANSVFALWRYGQSAYIPSVAQMRLLHASKKFVNPIIEKCGGEPLPDEAGECWYWTSTEVDGQETAKAWLYSMGSGSLQETPKDQAHKSRPIITINR